MSNPHLLIAQVTDEYGAVESEPVVVRLEGDFAHLELDDGRSVMVDAEELRGALMPDAEERVA